MREFFAMSVKITMTDDLVCQFTWLGNNDTAKFGDTRISNVFFSKFLFFNYKLSDQHARYTHARLFASLFTTSIH